MKLSEQELRILGAVELAADKPIQQIARETRMQTSSVQRHLGNLIDRGVIDGRTTIIDLARLGFIEHGLFIALDANSNQSEQLIIELNKHKQVSWIAEVGSKYDLMYNLNATSSRDVLVFLDRLTNKFPGLIKHKELVIRTERLRYWRSYLSGTTMKKPQFAMGNNSEIIQIDKRDQLILQALSCTKFESYRELANKTNLPISSFLRRLQVLRDSGLILGFGYRLNLDLIGVHQYRILISVAETSTAFKALKNYCEESGKVKLLTRCLGRFDFDLEVDIPVSDDIRIITKDLKNTLHKFKQEIQVIPIFKHQKYITFTPALLN